ncbi:MFS transporter [Kineococcus rhizosphaerae]|uniref:Putative MFS family arabinose efflux permease n=1 Tax=Kineococcus rhizosphaerae TaxID=559628 RepID=A0A2T0QTN1_9ACTN|nr:MFS transporter [Kineococcus rhizosphaerae]PRY08306.1 putative MFS family arabinose efflux permease [Kineococcus rhizosphaerae]
MSLRTFPRTSPRTGLTLVALTLGLLVAASAAPSPIFPVYEELWGAGPAAVTVVFAVYAAVLLVALLTVGSLSDHLGRRPVVLSALVGVVASMLLFSQAHDVTTLVVGRALQGFSTGTAIGALGAWLLDLAGPARAPLAQLLNGAVPPAGLMAGGLGAGVLVQFGPAPTELTYLVLAGLLLVAAVLVLLTPDVADRVPGAARSLKPVVRLPAASRRAFTTYLPGFLGSWGLGGLCMGLGPSVVAGVLGLTNHVVGGLVVASVAGVGALTGLLTRRLAPARVMALGMAGLVVGPLVLTVGLALGSVAGFFAGALLSGVGFGAGFQGALRGVLATAPAHERAGVLSAVYVVSYLAFGLPAVVAGSLAPHLGLVHVVDGYTGLVVLAGLAGLLLVTRERRATAPVPAQARRTPCPETEAQQA